MTFDSTGADGMQATRELPAQPDGRSPAQELQRAAERYALVMEATGEGVWDWIIPSDDYYVSPNLLAMYGLPPDKGHISRAELLEIFPVHPDDRQRWLDALDAHLRGQSNRFDIELRFLRDGELRWSRLTGLLTRDDRGTPIRWTGAVNDVTQRKRTEEALARSKERFALAVAGSNVGIWDWDVVTGLMFQSEQTQRLHGLVPGPTLRQREEWRAAWQLHPDDVEIQRRAVDDHVEGRTPVYEGEWRVRHPDGSYRWVRASGLALRDESGRAVRITGSVTDIDARKRAEAALRESEQRYALAGASANEGVFEWDMVQDRVFVSHRLQPLFGFGPGDLWRDRREWQQQLRFHPDDIEDVRIALSRHLRNELPAYDVECRLYLPDGSCRWFHQRSVALRDANGKPCRMAGNVSDITERKRTEQELRDMERQLRQAQRLEAMGTLAGGIAHDFNNILGAILGYGEMALRDAPRGSRLRRDLDSILAAGERGRALVDRILAFSRSGLGERVAVNVQFVVSEALELVAAQLPENIRIATELHAERAAMLGDPTQVHQVVMNLATNAAQAMTHGGTLRVSLHAQRLEGPRVATTGRVGPGEVLVLTVTDNGVGIAVDIIERIFDPFFTTKDVGVGTGLGLSLVHGIVSDVGGAVDVLSTPGAGSTFTVYLPRSGDVAPDTAAPPDALPRGARQHVLLVDDEELLVKLSAENLAELDYVVLPFTSSAAALQAFRAHPERYDAVVTDERMPGLSGTALIAQIHEIREDIPALLVSGYIGADLVQRAREAGAFEVLKKPLKLRDLAMALRDALHDGPRQR